MRSEGPKRKSRASEGPKRGRRHPPTAQCQWTPYNTVSGPSMVIFWHTGLHQKTDFVKELARIANPYYFSYPSPTQKKLIIPNHADYPALQHHRVFTRFNNIDPSHIPTTYEHLFKELARIANPYYFWSWVPTQIICFTIKELAVGP